jgi:hypothetical protein
VQQVRWWRAHRQVGGRVALFALLLQLALSFGHVHVAHADEPGLAVAPASDARGGSATPQPQHPDEDHDSHYCAIYAILALLTGAQTAAAPVIAMPAPQPVVVAPIAAAAVGLAARHASFRSRAPPLS